ncbi:hypothetical protein H4R18_000310 [Coemansia javaensis]|uniref:F-box domain-containing protein n=1 Tax=Coemansia javaensis TaxID=2761396 RepID=A0A9W8LN74_9FUNG|nr:hypothetical protein H4R18_000310 [Coemansia javaensis]
MEPPDPEDEQCTCPAFTSSGEHTPMCMLYTPLSHMDIPEWRRRSSGGCSSSSRPPSYAARGIGIGAGAHYPPPSTVSSVAESYGSASSVLDSMVATETESLSSYQLKRSTSVCSISSAASACQLLPSEMLRAVFLYLGADDLRAVVQVSRQWRAAGNPLLWRTMVFPLDKRRLAAMKPILSHVGRHVRHVIVAPAVERRRSDRGLSRRVSASTPRAWPLSRSGSTSSHYAHAQAGTLGRNDALADHADAPVSSAARGTAAAEALPAPMSEASSTLPSPQAQLGPGLMPPPSPLLLSSPRQHRETPSAAISPVDTPGAGAAAARRPSRTSVALLPSPMLPPVYAVPIPGTPGPGNVLSDSHQPSSSGGSWGATGLVGASAPGRAGAAPGHNPYQHHETSEGTVLRMHQFMERYCTHVLAATVKNPAGISSHGRRLGILTRLFRAYPRLERLDLSDFIMWDTQPLQLASEQLRMLVSLDVTNRVELGDGDLLPVIQSCGRLRELRIRATNATDATIRAVVRHMADALVSLDVGGCSVSSAAMSELVTTCRRLRVLKTWSCLRLDNSFLLALDPRVLTQLQVLDMMDVRKFSAEAIRRTFLQQEWPCMRYLRVCAQCTREDFGGVSRRAVLKLNTPTILD